MGRGNRNRNGKNNGSGNDRRNRKATITAMAIVHVAFKSSSTAPPASAHAQYITREGQYEHRGGVELVEFGNMPQFAQADPQAFWVAADAHERANGRTYTELQIALPRELEPEQRQELAREATRELLGERFAYTLAVHTPLAKDNIEQPHMHLMFSERVVDSNTQSLSEDRFFKRNGAKKDPAWNDRNKPEEVRERWVEMMNAAMERHGHIRHPEQRLDARSWAEQGRGDLASLREEKTLRGDGPEAMERHREIERLRQVRAELPPPHLDQAAAIAHVERGAEREIAGVEERTAREVSRLDRLIAAARELAVEVKDKATAFGRNVAERVEGFFGKRDVQTEIAFSSNTQEQARAPSPSPSPPIEEQLDRHLAAFDQRLAFEASFDAQLAVLDRRMEAQAKAQEAQELSRKQQSLAPEKKPEKEQENEREHGYGFGIGR